LGVGGAAAVACDQEFAAGAQRGFDRLRYRRDRAEQRAILRRALQGTQRAVEVSVDKVVGVRRSGYVPSFSPEPRAIDE
jgi:hypothetical protein